MTTIGRITSMVLFVAWTLAWPLAGAAQSTPATAGSVAPMDMDGMSGMDHVSMPGMVMPAAASSTATPAPTVPVKKTEVKPVPSPSTPASHDMDGMSGMKDMDHGMPGMDHGAMAGMTMPASAPPATPAATAMKRLDAGQMIGVRPVSHGLDTGGGMQDMQGMDMSSMQGGAAPPDARSPDYSDGHGYGSMRGMDMADAAPHSMLLLDQFEYVHGDTGNAVALDAQAWYGGDIDKAWFKVDGEYSGGRLGDLRAEALWSHAVSVYWNTQVGARHDFGEGPGRNWAAFGVQGLAPYRFDIEATAYVGPSGRTAARFEAEYELMFTQRLILSPDIEVNLYGKDDPARRLGGGLSSAEFGLRLRYEVRRRFAPYVGVVWHRAFGTTADYARVDGKPALDRQFVAGLRIWF